MFPAFFIVLYFVYDSYTNNNNRRSQHFCCGRALYSDLKSWRPF